MWVLLCQCTWWCLRPTHVVYLWDIGWRSIKFVLCETGAHDVSAVQTVGWHPWRLFLQVLCCGLFVSCNLLFCLYTEILYSFNMLIVKHSMKLWKCFYSLSYAILRYFVSQCSCVYSTAVSALLYIQYYSFCITLHTVYQFLHYFTYSTAVCALLYIQYCSFCITLHTVLQFIHYFTYSTSVSALLYIQYCSFCITLHLILQSIHYFTYICTLHSVTLCTVKLSVSTCPSLPVSCPLILRQQLSLPKKERKIHF